MAKVIDLHLFIQNSSLCVLFLTAFMIIKMFIYLNEQLNTGKFTLKVTFETTIRL